MKAKSEQILIQYQFDEKSRKPNVGNVPEIVLGHSKIYAFSVGEVTKAIDEYNEGKEKDLRIDETQINEVFEA